MNRTRPASIPRSSLIARENGVVFRRAVFIFGSPDGDAPDCRSKYAEDQVKVSLTREFEISMYEVTRAEWQDLGFSLPKPLDEIPCPQCSIVLINIYEAMAYLNALSEKAGLTPCYDLSSCKGTIGEGRPYNQNKAIGCWELFAYSFSKDVHRDLDPYACEGYRLPITAEWEYAARAGTRTVTYAGDVGPLEVECVLLVACYSDRRAGSEDSSMRGSEDDRVAVAGCRGEPDFTLCSVVTQPDRSYDICIDGECRYPGCGTRECNVPGPAFTLPDTGLTSCFSNYREPIACPVTAGAPDCAETAFCGQDGVKSSSFTDAWLSLM